MDPKPQKVACACGCGERFEKQRSDHKYFNRQCADRAKQRRYRQAMREAREIVAAQSLK